VRRALCARGALAVDLYTTEDETMQVTRISQYGQLAELQTDWNRLAGDTPFRRWQWLASWWDQYGDGNELFVLCVRDDAENLLGVAPFWIETSRTRGRILRLLGGGEVCTDYAGVFAKTGSEDAVTKMLADWLVNTATDKKDRSGDRVRWDLMELTGVAEHDETTRQLIEKIGSLGNTVHERPGMNCWRIALPETWQDYLTMLSKSHRKQIRRLENRVLATDRAKLHTAGNRDELRKGMEILVDLHQRRRESLDQPGCFSSVRFSRMLDCVAERLLDQGQLRLHWLTLDGKPVAAEFQLRGGDVRYAYQAGVDPDALDREPGRLINIATIQHAIGEGCRSFDFLRGDEPYKAHFRAEPETTIEYRVVPNRPLSRLRHQVWRAGGQLKRWIKNGMASAGLC
jgi:CelD/BcsL family acetyltransferase involved in cellulose biosynthesis